MHKSEFISIGKITGTHGYKGLVKVTSFTDFPERFFELEKVIVDDGKKSRECIIEKCTQYKQQFLIKFQNIHNLETAREYLGSLLKITGEQLYPLPEGHYYHFQLTGLQVYDVELGKLGEITEIIETGANDVYVVPSAQYGEILIPAIKDVILDVNLGINQMQVKLLPGLIRK